MSFRRIFVLFWIGFAGCFFEANAAQGGTFAPSTEQEWVLELAKFAVSILGFGGTVAALVFGVLQYRRNQLWRRAEFVAEKTKEFLDDPEVRNALLMIDWGERPIELFANHSDSEARSVVVNRETQWKALRPHVVPDEAGNFTFDAVEARIRDSYDAFLDGLERLATFVDAGLFSLRELRPHIGYWFDDLTADATSVDEARWRCTLFTYIAFYRFRGVLRLFDQMGMAIDHDGERYRSLEAQMQSSALAARLRRAL